MPKPSEYWSEEHAHSSGKPDANLATDALQLGGIDAEDYATKKYVQDFHNNKEELLKEYIDSQDIAKLQEAKNYVDTMIRNQDFSMFAKMTDLQALSENLNAKIEACKTECQQEMNTRISAVVQDVNDNFNNVNGAISQLNTKTNELFTSVSNGKDLVADAITDKGIHTSATDSFSTMATNIRNIQTEGGGEYDENFVNTADGNATSNDIMLGKIAYVKGNKIIGSHIDEEIDLSDATATPYDILTGKTAYTGNGKIEGLLTIDETTHQPSYNIGSVEKIYGTIVDKIDAATRSINSIFNFSSETIYCFGYHSRFTGIDQFKVMASSNGSNLVISSISDGYVESTEEDGILKTIYSSTDLGLASDEIIVDMAISDLASSYPYMAILAGKPNASGHITSVTLYLYHIEYDNIFYTLDLNNITKRTVSAISSTISFCFRSDSTYQVGRRKTLLISDDGTKLCLRPCSTQTSNNNYLGYYTFYKVYPSTLQTDYIGALTYPWFIIKNRFSFPGYFYNNFFICEGVIISINSNTQTCTYYTLDKCRYISKDLTFAITSNDNDTSLYYQSITINADKTLTLGEKVLISQSNIENYLYPIGNNNGLDFYSSSKTKVYNINDTSILELYDLEVDGSTSPEITLLGDSLVITKKTSAINIYSMVADYSKIIGLRYEGDFYLKQDTTILTATPSDVKKGKTFISGNGTQQTGTLEV